MLSSLRVLDLCGESGFLAGKILGDLGADVIKIEPPGGDPARRRGPFVGGIDDPERSIRWLALNTSKRSLVLDLSEAAQREQLLRLADEADVLLESFEPGTADALGLGWEKLHERCPRLVVASITPFGRSGPYAHYRGSDLVIVAMGGNASMTGFPDRAPLRCSMPTSEFHAAPEAVLGVLMAICARARSGRGALVDVSMQECQLGSLLSGAGQYASSGSLRPRRGAHLGRTREIWPASDGYVSFGLRGGAARIKNLEATVAYMRECDAAPDWLLDFDWQQFNPWALSDDEIGRFEQVFGDFFACRSMRELYSEALGRRILLAPCNDAREILAQPQLRSRALFETLEYPELGVAIEHPGFFARSDSVRIGLRSRAPRIGEHSGELPSLWKQRRDEGVANAAASAGGGIYAGLKILELGAGAAGPVATRYFAEQGAHVVRIESAARPDFLRTLLFTKESASDPHALEKSPMFALLNADKDSLALNLRKPEAVELVYRLAAWADVVAENFAPGVMDRLRLDYQSLRAHNPQLIMLSGCLFGQTGPQRSYPGFGGQGSAIAGFNHLTGWPDAEAHGPYATITDSLSPRYVAVALAAALLHRDRTGEGQRLDVSQIEAGVYSLSEIVVRYSANEEVECRRGNHHEFAAPHAVYVCSGDDRWIAIAVFDDDEWTRLRGAMGDPDWACDSRFDTLATRLEHQDELDRRIGEWTASRDAHALMRELQEAGVSAGAVQNFADLHEDPQLAHREHFVRLKHRHLGELAFERSGLRIEGAPGILRRPGPELGEHSRELLRSLLGLSDPEIDTLVADGVVA